MRPLATACSVLTAAVALFALPAQAGAEYLVPPGNSAATQYTEAVPTAGGHRDTEREGSQKSRNPDKVLGASHTKKLEEQGPAGREAAEFAAETAPSGGGAVSAATESGEPGSGPSEPNTTASKPKPHPGSNHQATQKVAGSPPTHRGNDGPSGSGGAGEVLGQATGSASGELGLWLPLAILSAAAWALAFFLRKRQQPTS